MMAHVSRVKSARRDVPKTSSDLALLKSLDADRRSKMEWPEFVNVVGQTEQESLFALRGERTARCFGREFAFDRAEDSFGVNALPIALGGKSGAHLRTHSVQLPVGLASFSRNNALRANLLGGCADGCVRCRTRHRPQRFRCNCLQPLHRAKDARWRSHLIGPWWALCARIRRKRVSTAKSHLSQ